MKRSVRRPPVRTSTSPAECPFRIPETLKAKAPNEPVYRGSQLPSRLTPVLHPGKRLWFILPLLSSHSRLYDHL